MDSIALAAYKLAKNGVPGPQGKPGNDGQDGIDGKNGLTPYIGENGNWFIGDTDTGVKAEGVDGINITITDIVESTEDEGENIVTFSNGQKLTVKNGGKGSQGDKPIKGEDYFTPTDKEEIVDEVKKEFTNVYRYAGSVAKTSELPKDLLLGDAGLVYNIEEDGTNYAWTGEDWDPLGLTLNNISYEDLKDIPVSNNYKINTVSVYNLSDLNNQEVGRFYYSYYSKFQDCIDIEISGTKYSFYNLNKETIEVSNSLGTFTFSLDGHEESTGGDTAALTQVLVTFTGNLFSNTAIISFKWYTTNKLDNKYLDLDNIQRMIDNKQVSYNNLTDKPVYQEKIYDTFNLTEQLRNGERVITLNSEEGTDLTVQDAAVRVTYSTMGVKKYYYSILEYNNYEVTANILCDTKGPLAIKERIGVIDPASAEPFVILTADFTNIDFDDAKDDVKIDFYKEIPFDTNFLTNNIQQMIDTSISKYDAEASALIGEVE